MTERHIVAGPAGCGKTRWVARQVARCAEKYGPDSSLVVSLTRAAATEAAGRVPLSKKMVGTLHSHCYRALGAPRIVDQKMLGAWNEEHPEWEIRGGLRGELDDDHRDSIEQGDMILDDVERARHTMTPLPVHAQKFAAAYEDFKRQCDACDFTDLIERTKSEVPLPPGGPSFLVADEAQDLSNLEISLLDRWSQHVDRYALVGDGNQSIYGWRHSSPMMSQTKPTIALSQSFRVPRAVHATAVELISRSSTYLDVEYQPRPEDGLVETLGATFNDGDDLYDLIGSLDGSVMVIASCGYMLRPLVKELRSRLLPYCNPFRINETQWNPLALGTERRRTAMDRLVAFLRLGDFLTGEAPSFETWQLELVRKMLLQTAIVRGSKEIVAMLPDGVEISALFAAAKRMLRPEALAPVMRGDTRWLRQNLRADAHKSLDWPLDVLDDRGLDQMLRPQVIVGTIHSVKGGEADHVILAPDLSKSGGETFDEPGWHGYDSVLRLFYVGCTRARKSLHVLDAASSWSVPID